MWQGGKHSGPGHFFSRRRWLAVSACALSATLRRNSRASERLATQSKSWPVEVTFGRFKLHSDFEIQDLRALQSQLLNTSTEVGDLLNVQAESKTVHVVLFQTAREYLRYMQNYFPALPQRRAIYLQDRGPGMLFTHWHENVATDLRHEVTHALLNDGASQLPLWIDEGLAEYFEVESAGRFSGSPYVDEVVEWAAGGYVPSLKELESLPSIEQFSDSRYRDSWAWVHYMVHRSTDTRQILQRYVREARSGQKAMPLSRQLSPLVSDLSRDYQLHFQQLRNAP